MPILILIVVVVALYLLWPILTAIASFIMALVDLAIAVIWIIIGACILGAFIFLCVKCGRKGKIAAGVLAGVTVLYLLFGNQIMALRTRLEAQRNGSSVDLQPTVVVSSGPQASSCSRGEEDEPPVFPGQTPEARQAKFGLYQEHLREITQKRMSEYEQARAKRLEAHISQTNAMMVAELARRTKYEGKKRDQQSQLETFERFDATMHSMRDDIRRFALQESPTLWETLQNLRADIQTRDIKIAEYRETAAKQGIPLEDNAQYTKICYARNMLVRSLRTIQEKLNTAFLLKKQCEAMPTKREYSESLKNALSDGLKEAESIGKRQAELQKIKEED